MSQLGSEGSPNVVDTFSHHLKGMAAEDALSDGRKPQEAVIGQFPMSRNLQFGLIIRTLRAPSQCLSYDDFMMPKRFRYSTSIH
jgi:hypothetical protein